jgi:hypothetical protein
MSLGAAGQFAVLGVNGGNVSLDRAHLTGDVGLGPNARGDLLRSDVEGTLFVDPTATARVRRTFNATGGIVAQDLAAAAQDANAASVAFDYLTPTQVLDNLTRSVTLTGNGGVNVVSVNSVRYNGDTLTLDGGANDVFIFNVAGRFNFANSRVVLTGGVTANHVLFNFPTAGAEINITRARSDVNGTFLAPHRSLDFHNRGTLNGAVIARAIKIEANANVSGDLFTAPSAPAPASSLSGYVFLDSDDDGVKDDDLGRRRSRDRRRDPHPDRHGRRGQRRVPDRDDR